MATPPLNRDELDRLLVNFCPHNLREGMHALVAWLRWYSLGIPRKLVLCTPNIYPADFDPTQGDPNWWKYSTDQCRDLLGKVSAAYSRLDLGPLNSVNTHTSDNSFVAACRQSGIRYILGFCAPTVIEDGGWEIAHYGSPLSPYFISEEDSRKPEPGTRNDHIHVQHGAAHPLVCLNHWSGGPCCPLNALAAGRWLEPTADP